MEELKMTGPEQVEQESSGRHSGPESGADPAMVQRPTEPTAVGGTSPRRRLTRATRRGLAVLLTLVMVEGTGLGVRYLLTDHRYVITNNAQVDGDVVDVIAPAEGTVTGWRITEGSSVTAQQIVGWVQLQGGGYAQPKKAVRAPGSGQVARNSTSNGQYVTTGARLAVVFRGPRTDGIYVTARVPEEKIGDVHPGAAVDIQVDAASGRTVTGVVQTVGAATAGAFSLDDGPDADPLDPRKSIYPGSDTNPQNPQRVDQYVPVKILFALTGDADLVPGTNVTVHIHRS